jgi:hypothetical protein
MLSIAAAISNATSIRGNLFDNMTSARRARSMLIDYYIYIRYAVKMVLV